MADVTINSKQVSTLTIGGNVVYSRWFKPLEYIESTGTQYIDTGIKGTENHKVDITFLTTTMTSSGLFGVKTVESSANKRAFLVEINTKAWCVYYQDSGSLSITSGVKWNITNNANVFTATNLVTGATLTTTVGTGGTFTTDSNMPLFACIYGTAISKYFTGRIYSAKIYEGDTLVRNFIPCILTSQIPPSKDSASTTRVSGTVGMWDTVNDMFYANAGTGDFGIPPYEQMQYIQADGTQYIDTGYMSNAQTKTIVKFQLTSATNSYGVFGSWVSSDSTATNYFYTNGGNFMSGCGKANKQVTFSAVDTNVHTITNDFVNLTSTFDSTSQSCNEIITTFTRSSLLFNMQSPTGTHTFPCSGKIFSAQFYTGSTLVRNFIPCILNTAIDASKDSQSTARSAGEIGMWDTVTDKFYGNAGTGTFIAG